MLGEHERADAQIHYRQAEVEALPQWDGPVLRAIYECADQRTEREACEHEARVLLHIRFRGESHNGNARSRLERAQTEPRHAYGDQARTPDGLLAARLHISRGLFHGSLHFGGRLAFGTCAVARVLHGRFGLQRFGTCGLALSVFLAGHAGLACQLRL